MRRLFSIELKRQWREKVITALISSFILVGVTAYVSAYYAQTIVGHLSGIDNIADLIPAPTDVSIVQSFFKASSQLAWMVAVFLVCRSSSIGSTKAQKDYFASCMKFAGWPIAIRALVTLSLAAASYLVSLLLNGTMLVAGFDGFPFGRFLVIGIEQMAAMMTLSMLAATISCWTNRTIAGFLSAFCLFTLSTVFAALQVRWFSDIVSVIIPNAIALHTNDSLPILRTLAITLAAITIFTVTITLRPLRQANTYFHMSTPVA